MYSTVRTTSKTVGNKNPITATTKNSSLSHLISEILFFTRLWCSSKLLHRLQLCNDSNIKEMRDGVSFCGQKTKTATEMGSSRQKNTEECKNPQKISTGTLKKNRDYEREKSPEMQPIHQVCFSTGRGWAVLVARGVLRLRGDLGVPVTQWHPRNIRMDSIKKRTFTQTYAYNLKQKIN